MFLQFHLKEAPGFDGASRCYFNNNNNGQQALFIIRFVCLGLHKHRYEAIVGSLKDGSLSFTINKVDLTSTSISLPLLHLVSVKTKKVLPQLRRPVKPDSRL